MIQYAPSTIVIFVEYLDLSVLLIFGLVTFIFSKLNLRHSRRYMHFTAITTFTNILYFLTVELIQNTPLTLTLPYPFSFPLK